MNFNKIISLFFFFFFSFKCLAEEVEVKDPLEPINRTVFKFNTVVDGLIFDPLVSVYKGLTPDIVEKGVTNFISNIFEPLSALNFILQGEFKESGKSLSRFVVNSVSSLGFYDTAKHINLEKNPTNFGSTLTSWGISNGPYLVLPIVGPSDGRGALGKVGDFFINPINTLDTSSSTAIKAADGFQQRVDIDEDWDNLKETSFDLYESTRSIYFQKRDAEQNEDYIDEVPTPKIFINNQ